MDRIEDEATNLLAPLRDAAPSGQPGVDIAKAKSIGRRQSRRRMVAGMVAAASLVVVAGLGVPALIHNLPDATTPARQATTEFGLFERVVTVGSAGGFTPDTYETRRDRQITKLKRADGGQGTATIEVFALTHAPYPDAYFRVGTRAADVNGREAYWIGQGPALVWSWAKGAWATVTWENVPDQDVKDKIHRVALSVQPASVPVTVPFTMARTDLLNLRSVRVSTLSPVSTAVFTYASPNDGPLTISVGLANAEPGLVADTHVNGRPAIAGPNLVKILDTGHDLVAVAASDGKNGAPELLKQLATSIQVVPGPADRATWSPTLWR